MMEPNRQYNPLEGQFDAKDGIGYLLILSGLMTTFGVLVGIYLLFVNPQQLAAFRSLFPEQLTVTWEGNLITIPPEVLVYSLPIILLLIAGGMTSTLINAGIKLLTKR